MPSDGPWLAAGGVALLAFVLAWCRIFAKAGFHAGLGLLMLVPGVNLVLLFVLALVRWPLEREVRGLRPVVSAVHRHDRRRLRRA